MKISIVIPVYNVEKYVARCLNSILNQSFQDFEVILVNDASTDGSLKIVEKYAQLDKRFVVISHERNMGQMWTRKTGYSRAKGEYIIFCDSDDYLLPDALQILYDAILSSGADIVASSFIRKAFDTETVLLNRLSYGNKINSVYKSLLLGEFYHSLWAKIFKASLFRDYSYETFEYQTNGEDAILFYQVLAHCKEIISIFTPTYCYQYNPNSSTVSIDKEKVQRMLFSQIWQYNYLKGIDSLSEILIPKIILNRVSLLRYENISVMQLFPEQELRNLLSFYTSRRYFSLNQSIKVGLLTHCSIIAWCFRTRYRIHTWLLRIVHGFNF